MFNILCGSKQIQQILSELNDFRTSQLGLTVDTIHERNRHLANGVVQLPGPNNHLHLEDVALGLAAGDELFEHILFVQPERSGQVRGVRPEQQLGQEVRSPGDELSLKVPPVDTAISLVASP